MNCCIYGMYVLPLRLVDLSLLGCASAADHAQVRTRQRLLNSRERSDRYDG